jgi:hypothetical protein
VITLAPVLILPPGHFQQTQTRVARRKRRRGEKWFIAVGSLVTLAIVAVVAFSLTTHQKTSGHGCIDFNYLTMIGGAEMYQCGDRARIMCASAEPKNDPDPGFYKDMDVACREAGLQTGTR